MHVVLCYSPLVHALTCLRSNQSQECVCNGSDLRCEAGTVHKWGIGSVECRQPSLKRFSVSTGKRQPQVRVVCCFGLYCSLERVGPWQDLVRLLWQEYLACQDLARCTSDTHFPRAVWEVAVPLASLLCILQGTPNGLLSQRRCRKSFRSMQTPWRSTLARTLQSR